MSQSIGSSIGYSRKRLKRLNRPSLNLNAPIPPTGLVLTSNLEISNQHKTYMAKIKWDVYQSLQHFNKSWDSLETKTVYT